MNPVLWTVEIHDNPYNEKLWFVANRPDLLAEILSKSTDAEVWLGAKSRLRRIYRNGEVVKDWPDLGEFYTDVTDHEAHDWKMFNELHE